MGIFAVGQEVERVLVFAPEALVPRVGEEHRRELLRAANAQNLVHRQVGHVQVVQRAARQRVLQRPLGHAQRDFGGDGIVAAGKGAQRRSQRGPPGHGRLHRRVDRAGIDARAAQVRAAVDAGDHEVGRVVSQKIHAQPRAVGGRSVRFVAPRALHVHLAHVQRAGNGQRVADGAALTVGRAHGHAVPLRKRRAH